MFHLGTEVAWLADHISLGGAAFCFGHGPVDLIITELEGLSFLLWIRVVWFGM